MWLPRDPTSARGSDLAILPAFLERCLHSPCVQGICGRIVKTPTGRSTAQFSPDARIEQERFSELRPLELGSLKDTMPWVERQLHGKSAQVACLVVPMGQPLLGQIFQCASFLCSTLARAQTSWLADELMDGWRRMLLHSDTDHAMVIAREFVA